MLSGKHVHDASVTITFSSITTDKQGCGVPVDPSRRKADVVNSKQPVDGERGRLLHSLSEFCPEKERGRGLRGGSRLADPIVEVRRETYCKTGIFRTKVTSYGFRKPTLRELKK